MPFPSLAATRVVNPVLTNIAHGYRNGQFVGGLAFPKTFVGKRAGKIIRFNEDELYLHELRRSPGANTKRVSGDWGSDDYELYQDAVEEELPIEHIEESSDLPIDMQRRSINRAMYRIQLRQEFDELALLGSLTSYPAANRITLLGATQWSDTVNSNPEQQVDVAHQAILDACGMFANVGIISLRAFNAYKRHPIIRDKFKYVQKGVITKDMVAAVMGLKRLEIATAKFKSLTNPAAGRQEMFVNSFWMGYNPEFADDNMVDIGRPTPSVNSNIDAPSFGRNYMLKGTLMAEEPYYDRNSSTWYFPVKCDRRPVLTGMGAGYIFTNVSA